MNTPPRLHSEAEAFFPEGKCRLSQSILSREEDPDYRTIAEQIPQNGCWDFIATEASEWKYLVWPNGKIGIMTTIGHDYEHEIYCAFDPKKEGYAFEDLESSMSLMDGYLPVSIISYRNEEGNEMFRQQSFVHTEDSGETIIYIRIEGDNRISYYQAMPPESKNADELKALDYRPVMKLHDRCLFYRRLSHLTKQSKELLAGGMQVETPEQRITEASQAAILKSINTYVNETPRYGMTKYYVDHGISAWSFPPTTITMVTCCLEWGLFDRAHMYLTYFLDTFVTPKGEILHRDGGASVSEYGMMLDTIARYVSYTNDHRFRRQHGQTIADLCDHILYERESSKELPRNSINYGLIKGCPEDDLRAWKPAHWYSGNCWAWRGLQEILHMLDAAPELDEASLHLRDRLKDECPAFKEDILVSVRQSLVDAAPTFLPPYPGYDQPFPDMAGEIYYQDETDKNLLLSAYANYRIYPEMLSADILGEDLSDLVIDYREQKGGELLGMTVFSEKRLDNWPLYNYLWSLANHDHSRKFLMTYYAHMAHHQARDTYFAPEFTGLDRLGAFHCVPSQLTIPLATKWMLVFEERDKSVLRLNWASPKRWLAHGESITVTDAPTRWGLVSFRIDSQIDDGLIAIEVDLPDDGPEEVLCRLRPPSHKARTLIPEPPITSALVDHMGIIKLHPGSHNSIRFTVHYARHA